MADADNIQKSLFQPFTGFPKTSSKDNQNVSLLDATRDLRKAVLAEKKVKRGFNERIKDGWKSLYKGAKSGDSNSVQKVLDRFGNRLEGVINKSPAGKLKTEWLDKTAKGKWYVKLGDFILKLPLRVAMNLLKFIYSIIKGALYSFVHPIKALKKFNNHVVDVVNKLKQPLTWTKIGAGIIGASVGSSLVTGNPIAVIGLGIGGALLLGGVISGIAKEAIKNERGELKEAVKKELIEHIKGVPMAFLTGFVVGATAGAIMQATAGMQSMGAAGAAPSNLTATPPPLTLGLPPILATHLHHGHPKAEKTDIEGEEKKKI